MIHPVKIKFARANPDAVIPKFAHQGDSGFDLYIIEETRLEPNERKKIRTGLICELPYNYEIQIRPRSGISTKTKLVIIFATIDSCYRGEIHIIAHNTAETPLIIKKGLSIAQGVVCRVPDIIIEEIPPAELTTTSRGNNGFGSTTNRPG